MIRSLLIAPANRPDLVAKFHRFGADCNVIDLEDGTPSSEKELARASLNNTIAIARDANTTGLLMVRVNIPSSPHYLEDIEAAFACDIDGVVVPKLETTDQLYPANKWIELLDKKSPRAQPRFIIGGIESVTGVLNAVKISAEALHLSAIYFGAEDYSSDIGGRRTSRGDEVHVARSMVVMAAKAAGLTAIDQVVIDIRNDELFKEDAGRARDLGYNGKTCLTPGQVELANVAFSPSEEEILYAKRLVSAYEDSMSQGIGTIDFEGKMVDLPLLKRAQSLLSARR